MAFISLCFLFDSADSERNPSQAFHPASPDQVIARLSAAFDWATVRLSATSDWAIVRLSAAPEWATLSLSAAPE
jgi:hypothetical protein